MGDFKKVCEMCGKDFIAHASNALRCPECRVVWLKNYVARYNKTERKRELCRLWARKNRLNPAVREKNRLYSKKYYREHREESNARRRKWFEKNRDLYNLNARIRRYDNYIAYWNSLQATD